MTTNYANKRVLIKSKEHLDYVIEVTGMDCRDLFYDRLLEIVDHHLIILFSEDFNFNKDDWAYDYYTGLTRKSYNGLTMKSEEIFIDLLSMNQPTTRDFHDDEHLNELWLAYLSNISESISEIKPKDLAKNFAKFTLDKMEK